MHAIVKYENGTGKEMAMPEKELGLNSWGIGSNFRVVKMAKKLQN